MGLLQNMTRYAAEPIRWSGGPFAAERSMMGAKLATNLNRFVGEAGMDKANAIPGGYESGAGAWLPSIKGGGMSAYVADAGTSTGTVNLAQGVSIESTMATEVTVDAVLSALALMSSSLSCGVQDSAEMMGKAHVDSTATGSSTETAILSPKSIMTSEALGTNSSSLDLSCVASLLAEANGTSSSNVNMAGILSFASTGSGGSTESASMSPVAPMESTAEGYSTISAEMVGLAPLESVAEGSSESSIDMFNGISITSEMTAGATETANMSGVALCESNLSIGAEPSPAEIAATIWSSLAAEFNDSGTMGAKVNAAGTAGDPWGAELPADYIEGTAGKMLSDKLSLKQFLALK